jgi:hypothetical protein
MLERQDLTIQTISRGARLVTHGHLIMASGQLADELCHRVRFVVELIKVADFAVPVALCHRDSQGRFAAGRFRGSMTDPKPGCDYGMDMARIGCRLAWSDVEPMRFGKTQANPLLSEEC